MGANKRADLCTRGRGGGEAGLLQKCLGRAESGGQGTHRRDTTAKGGTESALALEGGLGQPRQHFGGD